MEFLFILFCVNNPELSHEVIWETSVRLHMKVYFKCFMIIIIIIIITALLRTLSVVISDIYLTLFWVFLARRGLFPVEHRGHSASSLSLVVICEIVAGATFQLKHKPLVCLFAWLPQKIAPCHSAAVMTALVPNNFGTVGHFDAILFKFHLSRVGCELRWFFLFPCKKVSVRVFSTVRSKTTSKEVIRQLNVMFKAPNNWSH